LHDNDVPSLAVNSADNEAHEPHLRLTGKFGITVDDVVVPRHSVQVESGTDVLVQPRRSPSKNGLELERVSSDQVLPVVGAEELCHLLQPPTIRSDEVSQRDTTPAYAHPSSSPPASAARRVPRALGRALIVVDGLVVGVLGGLDIARTRLVLLFERKPA